MTRIHRGRPPRSIAIPLIVVMIVAALLSLATPTSAQDVDVDAVASELADRGYYLEPGADGTDSGFEGLVRAGERTGERWYFASMVDSVPDDFADQLRDRVVPRGNVLVYFVTGGFANVQLATGFSESIEDRALAPFDENWATPEEFMAEVVAELAAATTATTSSDATGGSAASGAESSGGSGLGWLWIAVPVVLLIGGIWLARRSGRNKAAAANLERAQKIRDAIQTELDELANDVLVLSGPVDLCDKPDAIRHYREATETYSAISDEIADIDQLAGADLNELSALGARVAHARWQMDAAEAIIDGEPVPEMPKVAPPPAPPSPPAGPTAPPRPLPQRDARPRVRYSRSRRSSGGGLLDILIAGAGVAAGSRRGRSGGGMFGGASRSGGMFGGSTGARSSSGSRRPGGGVFGSGAGRTTSRSSSSRSRARPTRSSPRRSTSRSRRR